MSKLVRSCALQSSTDLITVGGVSLRMTSPLVGGSRPFLRWLLPYLKEHFQP
jgi:hypothetical protein